MGHLLGDLAGHSRVRVGLGLSSPPSVRPSRPWPIRPRQPWLGPADVAMRHGAAPTEGEK